jgi:hypothetical protein
MDEKLSLNGGGFFVYFHGNDLVKLYSNYFIDIDV